MRWMQIGTARSIRPRAGLAAWLAPAVFVLVAASAGAAAAEREGVVVLLEEDVRTIILLAAGGAALLVFAGMAAWISTLRREIAARRRMEEALRMRQARLESIFRGAPVGIGEVVDRKLVVANDHLLQMLGYAPEELIGQNSRLIYLSHDEWDRVGHETFEQASELGI